MRQTMRLFGFLATGLWVAFAAHQVMAFPSVARQTKAACAACHTNPGGGADLTDAGKAYKADSTKTPSAEVKGAEYVGVNKCKMCHLAEYKAWQETKHATAFSALAKGDPKMVADLSAKLKVEIKGSPDKTDACVTCHVVGFQLPGGYPAADSAKTAGVTNVACEACHGPGSLHILAAKADKKSKINIMPSEKMCRQCHTADTSPKFVFAEYKVKGVHTVKK